MDTPQTEVKQTDKKPEGTLIDTLPIEGKVEKNYVPEGYNSVEDFLTEMREEYDLDIEFDRENREQALSDKKFAAGEQWDPIVLEQRKGLPCLTINTIPQFTAQLVGDWRESRRGIKVVAANDEDKDAAEVRSELFREIENQSRATRVYSNSFESLVQCGDGAFRVSVETARNNVFDQDLFIRPIEDCLSVVWDRFSCDPTGKDAKRCFVNDRIPKTEYKRKYGSIPASTMQDNQQMRTDLEASGWVDDDSYQVTEYWRMIERTRLMSMFQNGEIFIINDDNIDELMEKYGPPVKTRSTQVSYAQMHLCTGFDILSGPHEYQLTRLPIIRMTGRVVNVGGRRVRAGIVRDMKDSARMKNFHRSVAAEQLGYAPKAKWMATESAVEGREDTLRKAHLSRDPILIFNDEAEFGKNVLRVDPPGIESALLNEAATNTQDMKDVTGIHDASLGIKSNETSGRAIMARQREGDVANLLYHDNANAAVLESADICNQLVPQIYDATRTLRVIGEDDRVKFVRINDPMDPDSIDMSKGMFDVIPQVGASYTTKRIEAAQSMMEAVQVYPDLMQIAGDLVANAQDWPGADKLASRLKKSIPPHLLGDDEEGGGTGISPEELQNLQQELQKLTVENQELTMETKNKQVEQFIAAYNAETQRIRALSDHEVDNQQLQMKAIENILQSSAKIDEMDIKRYQSESKNTPTAGGASNAPSSSGPQSQS